MESNSARARAELADVLDISRQALADVRLVARGYRKMSLGKEASAVAVLLPAAGITTHVDISCAPRDAKVDTVLATVLREAVTNTLRHSVARNCSIEAAQDGDTIRLCVINDGVSRKAAPDPQGGGLNNMAARLAAVGGRMKAGVRADGKFELIAETPISRCQENGTMSAPCEPRGG